MRTIWRLCLHSVALNGRHFGQNHPLQAKCRTSDISGPLEPLHSALDRSGDALARPALSVQSRTLGSYVAFLRTNGFNEGMNFGKCAYCGRKRPLSKEEVFPKFLAHKIGFHIFVDRRRGLKPLRLPPVLRDVCQKCNNVVLSQLDSYVSSLFKSHFLVPISSPVCVTFRYKFETLHRWLLKVVYNFARAADHRTDVFQVYIPYILGEQSEPKTSSTILVGVFEASQAQPHEIAAGMPETFSPMFHNIGEIKFSNVRWVKGFLSFAYCVTFASYCFQIIDFCEGTPTTIRNEIVDQILAETRFYPLDPSKSEILITRSVSSARDFLLNRERVENAIYRFSGGK